MTKHRGREDRVLRYLRKHYVGKPFKAADIAPAVNFTVNDVGKVCYMSDHIQRVNTGDDRRHTAVWILA